MNAPAYSSGERHVYRLKWWAIALYLTMGLSFFGFGLFCAYVMFASLSMSWQISLLAITCLLSGTYALAFALRSKLMLEGRRITLNGAFRQKTAEISQIAGYRTTWTRGGIQLWRLELKDGKWKIPVIKLFAVDQTFRSYLAQLKNLDNDKS
jgi:hypothetical protein